MAASPNRTVLMLVSMVCVFCAIAIAFLAHAIVLEETGSVPAAWTAVATTVGIIAFIVMLLLRTKRNNGA